jgi:hypothetical protein
MATETRDRKHARRYQRAGAPLPRPTTAEIQELMRLREAARRNGDEASRQAVLAFAVEHKIGAGAGTVVD